MTRLFLAMTAALGVTLAGGSGGALADEAGKPAEVAPAEVSVEIVILHATNDGSGIDPKIGKMPALAQPPFSSYNSYRLLDRIKLPLAKGKPSTTKLPTGRDLMVSLKDIIEPAKKDDLRRYLVTASIQKPDGNTFLPLLEVKAKPGEPFFVVGQTYKGGTVVIGIKVNP